MDLKSMPLLVDYMYSMQSNQMPVSDYYVGVCQRHLKAVKLALM